MRVLIVDDSHALRSVERGILGQLGHEDIAEAASADAAMEQIRESPPDLLIVDGEMPGREGLDLVRSYREAGGDAPVLMVTARAERERFLDALRAGVCGYLVKPFTPDLFAQRVREAAGGRRG